MRKTLIFTVAGVLVLCAAVTLRASKFQEADGALLRKATWQALHPRLQLIHKGDLLGMVQVPRLGLAVPFVEGSEGAPLEVGAGHIPHTAFPGHHGNAGIAAHRDTVFRPLKDIRPGDDIVITTPAGSYDYKVSSTEIVMPEENHVLQRTPHRTLTLVTCYPFFYVGTAPKRFIVHAEG
jgi:sortase A